MHFIINFYYTLTGYWVHWTHEVLPSIFNDTRVIDYESQALSETKDV